MDQVYESKTQNNMCEYSRSGLDSIVEIGIYTVIEDSSTIYKYESQGYVKNKYLMILDYMSTGQPTFTIHEYKKISFNKNEYLFYSNIEGVSGYSTYNKDSLTVYRIENDHLTVDNSIQINIDKFRNYRFFTTDPDLINSTYKDDFVFEFGENDNEISIVFNIDNYSYNEIEKQLKGNKLVLRFDNKIETELIKD